MATFFSGTSNIELEEKNKNVFPKEFQAGSRLSYYSSLFNSLEINSTFYKLPLPATLEKWAKEVPEHFRFTLKVFREITHTRGFAFNRDLVQRFMNIAHHIGVNKAALLIQLPAGTQHIHSDQLEKLLSEIKKTDPENSWKIAVEFRHPSWYVPPVYSLLERYKAAVVWHDKPFMDGEKASEMAKFVYLRFHGPKGDYKGSYPDDFLIEKAKQIRVWLNENKDVYAYFNNTMEGDAPKNLMTLNRMVRASQ